KDNTVALLDAHHFQSCRTCTRGSLDLPIKVYYPGTGKCRPRCVFRETLLQQMQTRRRDERYRSRLAAPVLRYALDCSIQFREAFMRRMILCNMILWSAAASSAIAQTADAKKSHWAFQPVKRPALPAVKND